MGRDLPSLLRRIGDFRHRYGFEIQLPKAAELVRELRDEMSEQVDRAIVDFVRLMEGRTEARPDI